MSEIKPSQFWIYKGTSNHCSQLEYDYETDTYEKSTPDGFYDYVCTKDTVQGGIHVLEAEPVLKLLREMGEALELSVYYQEKAKNFISHYDDCNALIDEESEGPCECGMEEFAHNNYISQNMAKEQIEKLNTFLASIDKEDGK